jgi:transcriptional regulator with PAS, ATPase and Fis domain
MSLPLDLKKAGIIGVSPAMKALACQIETAARSDLTVLITGESGTGKELVARAIHEHSARATMPFISFNCGALTETLLESELFGYQRGAFTGAHQNRIGLFEAADAGTIFLDEIGEMSTGCQVKLLRVLQENMVRPVGAHAETSIDVRVIAATNRNLGQEICLGRFREDLFYRIAVLTINTPSLRERSSDIPLLIDHFLRLAESKAKCSRRFTIEEDATTALCLYAWPGNVRQLRHIVERLVATTMESDAITTEAVRQALATANPLSNTIPHVPLVFRKNDSLDDFLDRALLGLYNHLKAITGSHLQVARALGIDRGNLYKRVRGAERRLQGSAFGEIETADLD